MLRSTYSTLLNVSLFDLSMPVWRNVEGLNPRDTNSKLAKYRFLLAVPFDPNVRAPLQLPRHLHGIWICLAQHVLQNVSRFRLRAHTLKVETQHLGIIKALLCVTVVLVRRPKMKRMPF
jgi:hypothetical protein